MKKLLTICIFITLCAPAFAAKDFGMSVSLDAAGNLSMGGVSFTPDIPIGYTLDVNWLFLDSAGNAAFTNTASTNILIIPRIRCGPGVSFSRELIGESPNFSDLAIYFTTQIYPVQVVGRGGFYIKGNVGFNLMFLANLPPSEKVFIGNSFSIGFGFDAPNGRFTEFVYNNYGWHYDDPDSGKMNCRYENLSIRYGIRF